MLPVLVLCGGRGTRLQAVTGGDTPKALVNVAGRPFIDHKLANLRDAGLEEVVLSVGFGGDRIRAHVGDGGALGVHVRYVDDGPCLRGTGGAVLAARPELPDTFWVTYGDSLLELDVGAAEATFRAQALPALMVVLHNRDRWGVSNALVRGERVVAYGKDPVPPGAEHIDYGMLVLTRALLESPDRPTSFDLALVLAAAADAGQLAAHEADSPFHDIGTPEDLRATDAFLRGRT
ncbi:MAG TPA: NTP transferase domain-containing protein [Acidimicrobiia bacterium]|nr:NTP transferase domain-containing protein [Acidimicrobiia bacterium]